jgi:glycosyltransferase involved in cell wall biosynthesis
MTERAKHIAMALYGDLSYDSRVQREARTLHATGYRVTVACLEVADPRAVDLPPEVVVLANRPVSSEILPGARSPYHPDDPGTATPRRGGRVSWVTGYIRNVRAWGRWAVRAVRPDAWHAHDLTGLAALGATHIFRTVPVVYDSHELYLESGTAMRLPRQARRLLRGYERSLVRRSAAVITVNDGVAGALASTYGVDPVVVLNCPPYREVDRPGAMRRELGLGARPVLLYHGALSPGRGIEATLAAMPLLPPEVAFVILGNGSLAPVLAARREDRELADRVFLHPAVPPRELLDWVVDADLVMVLQATRGSELNFRLSTPNKLFEAMMSGVPVVVSPFAVMRDIVEREGIGVLADPSDIDGIATTIGSLLGDPATLRQCSERARRAARTTYNWDRQAERLLSLYERVLATRAP